MLIRKYNSFLYERISMEEILSLFLYIFLYRNNKIYEDHKDILFFL